MQTGRPLHFSGLALALCLALVCPVMRAESVKLEKPVRLPPGVQKADKTRLAGAVVSFDDAGFDYTDTRGRAQTVRWDELDAAAAYSVRRELIHAAHPADEKARAAAYLELGRAVSGRPGGKELAEKAFAVALRLDPQLKDQVEQARAAVADGRETAGGDGKPGAASDGKAAGAAPGPQVVGPVQARFWGKLSDEDQAAHVKVLNAFAEDAAKKVGRPLALFETSYFLFYSDLPAREAANWAGLLDRMYARLAELFAVEKGANVWRGKALVFVFARSEDYHKFQALCHGTNSVGSDGMCHAYGDGTVHIAFYRQPQELDFAHVLVHESVHGFLHRYRSPARVPSWANEGLAEVIATELVPRNGRPQQMRNAAKAWLVRYNGMGGMFDAEHIQGWQYPVAYALCEYMIRQSKRNYVAFINGIKDGLSWEASLEQKYQAPQARLVQAFGESLGIKQLKE